MYDAAAFWSTADVLSACLDPPTRVLRRFLHARVCVSNKRGVRVCVVDMKMGLVRGMRRCARPCVRCCLWSPHLAHRLDL